MGNFTMKPPGYFCLLADSISRSPAMAEGYPGPYRAQRLEAVAGLISAAVVGGASPRGAEVEGAASGLHADHMWPRRWCPRWRAPRQSPALPTPHLPAVGSNVGVRHARTAYEAERWRALPRCGLGGRSADWSPPSWSAVAPWRSRGCVRRRMRRCRSPHAKAEHPSTLWAGELPTSLRRMPRSMHANACSDGMVAAFNADDGRERLPRPGRRGGVKP